MTGSDIWTYREQGASVADVGRPMDLAGYSVEALDGGIGKVDDATYDVGSSYIVVDTGPWIFGKKVLRQAHEGPDQGRARIERVDLSRRGLPLGSGELLRAGGSWVQRITRELRALSKETGRATWPGNPG